MLDLTKLIPSNIRVQRYVDLISAFQSYLYTEVIPKIYAFRDKSDITKVSLEDAKHMIYDKGHNLTSGEGYTSTLRYVRRQLEVLVKRLKIKSTWKSYQYLFYVYDLLGDTYPCIYKVNGTLKPRVNWLSSPDVNDPPLKLDSGLTLDQPLDDLPYWVLDAGDFVDFTTRHFILSYFPKFIENSTEFLSNSTCTAFFNDVNQNKRKVEIPHFEFRMRADTNVTGTDTVKVWKSYDGTYTANQHTIYILQTDIYAYNSTLNEAFSIQLGTGAHTVIDQSITGCQNQVLNLNLTDMIVMLQDANHLYVKSVIYPYEKAVSGITEISIKDTVGNCIYYTTFPKMNFDSRMLSHYYFNFTLSI